MAYFSDLTFYTYDGCSSPNAKNVGWLQRGHEFGKTAPAEQILDLLWSFCNYSIIQARGTHPCDLCPAPSYVVADRKGAKLRLGSAEIRVFSKQSSDFLLRQTLRNVGSGLLFVKTSNVPFTVYAAPNLIYHYVAFHHYKPPDEFVAALIDGPRPPSAEYFACLRKLNLEWGPTSRPE